MGGGGRGWRRAAPRSAPQVALGLVQVPRGMACTCFRVACSICSLLLPMQRCALAPERNAKKERGDERVGLGRAAGERFLRCAARVGLLRVAACGM